MGVPAWRKPVRPPLVAYVVADSLRQYQVWWGITGANPTRHKLITKAEELRGIDPELPIIRCTRLGDYWQRPDTKAALELAEKTHEDRKTVRSG